MFLRLAGDLLPFLAVLRGQWKDRRKCSGVLRVEEDVLAFAGRALQCSSFSLGGSVGHWQEAWEEQLMKRSNGLENCLT